jgi:hypothetical protein
MTLKDPFFARRRLQKSRMTNENSSADAIRICGNLERTRNCEFVEIDGPRDFLLSCFHDNKTFRTNKITEYVCVCATCSPCAFYSGGRFRSKDSSEDSAMLAESFSFVREALGI